MGDSRQEQKRRAARRAVEDVDDGMVLGLGSGSTAAVAIRELGRRCSEGLDIVGVATSYGAADVARTAGVPVRTLADVDGIDLAIDGADQVVDGTLVKGGGGAHAREKVIDSAADRFHVVVDESKLAERITHPIPVEVLPEARPLVADRIRSMGADPTVRRRGDDPVITDNGHHIIDAAFDELASPQDAADTMDRIPGVIEHGLFVDLADAIYVGTATGVVDRRP